MSHPKPIDLNDPASIEKALKSRTGRRRLLAHAATLAADESATRSMIEAARSIRGLVQEAGRIAEEEAREERVKRLEEAAERARAGNAPEPPEAPEAA